MVKIVLKASYRAVLERGLKERGLIREGDLLIIQGKKCFKNALVHFFCYGKLS